MLWRTRVEFTQDCRKEAKAFTEISLKTENEFISCDEMNWMTEQPYKMATLADMDKIVEWNRFDYWAGPSEIIASLPV